MKKLLLFLVGIILTSCTTEDIEPITDNINQAVEIPSAKNKFTIVWASNQVNPYVEFTKDEFKNCEVINSTMTVHRENKFEVELENGQPFNIQFKREESVKNPELYLAIYKGDELQYEREVNTSGFMLISFVNYYGNIAE